MNPFRDQAEKYKKMIQNLVSGDNEKIERLQEHIMRIEKLGEDFEKPKNIEEDK